MKKGRCVWEKKGWEWQKQGAQLFEAFQPAYFPTIKGGGFSGFGGGKGGKRTDAASGFELPGR